jgi:copper chaperone NosL
LKTRSLQKPVLLLLGILLLGACSSEPDSGPVEIRWDRETCARCLMSVSDHYYAVQVRAVEEGKRAKVYKFDDIGCAVVWLDEQPWADNPLNEIWVTDHRDGKWIDARNAWYITGKHTPMTYGFAAQSDPEDGAMTFEQAAEAIFIKDTELTGHEHHRHVQQETGQ